jgi:hypothetical protein
MSTEKQEEKTDEDHDANTQHPDTGDSLENADVDNDPAERREEAMCMAINIVIHALTH